MSLSRLGNRESLGSLLVECLFLVSRWSFGVQEVIKDMKTPTSRGMGAVFGNKETLCPCRQLLVGLSCWEDRKRNLN